MTTKFGFADRFSTSEGSQMLTGSQLNLPHGVGLLGYLNYCITKVRIDSKLTPRHCALKTKLWRHENYLGLYCYNSTDKCKMIVSNIAMRCCPCQHCCFWLLLLEGSSSHISVVFASFFYFRRRQRNTKQENWYAYWVREATTWCQSSTMHWYVLVNSISPTNSVTEVCIVVHSFVMRPSTRSPRYALQPACLSLRLSRIHLWLENKTVQRSNL